jgi:hypothetical protein
MFGKASLVPRSFDFVVKKESQARFGETSRFNTFSSSAAVLKWLSGFRESKSTPALDA